MRKDYEFSSPKGRVLGGIEPKHFKGTAETETVFMPAPNELTIPMLQHIGAPCEPTVKAGDEVFVGTKIGDSDKLVSAPIHSSCSGKIKAIKEIVGATGRRCKAVIIENDGKNTPAPSIAPPTINSKEELIDAVRECGLVGLGGAGFPTYVKLKSEKPLKTLIINAAECEPFITSDYRECLENGEDIFNGVYLLLEKMNFEEVIIAVEDNKPKALERLYEIASSERDGEDNRVRIMKIKTHYPQGAEKVLIYTVTKKKLGLGKLPADLGCVVMNVTSVATVGRYLKTGMPLTRKRLTVDGDIVGEAKNVSVAIGTPISDVIDFCGGLKAAPVKVLMGGPMMGVAIADLNTPVLKQNNAILAFGEKMADMRDAEECIRCGRCAAACPMGLSPFHIAPAAKRGDKEALKELYAEYCMECGCCAYSCPSKRPIVEVMRKAKTVIKNG